MNESLASKANKVSVANALQRKVNRSDLDTFLETKADISDLDKICGILENKAELAVVDSLKKQFRETQSFVTFNEF